MAGKERRERVESIRYNVYGKEIVSKAMKTLRELPYGEPKKQQLLLMRQYLRNNHYQCTVSPERPIKPEYKLLIRDDCNGDIYAVDKNFLSFHYKYSMDMAQKRPEDIKSTTMDYVKVLQASNVWQDIRTFPSYEAVEALLIEKINQMRIPHQFIKAFEVNDFRDLVRNLCGKEFSEFRKRESQIKAFIKAKEESFREMLHLSGTDERYTNALVEKMKTKGEAWGVVIYDDDGRKIDGPEFDRHHTIPVYSPDDVESLNEVNDFNNICLIEKNFHHWLHKLERSYMQDDVLYFEKIMVPENAACILNFETYIAHDYDNPERKIFMKQPRENNQIYLNKISEATTCYAGLLPSTQREKTPNKYVHKGGKGRR